MENNIVCQTKEMKTISIEEFEYLKNSIGVLDTMVHDIDKYETVVIAEPQLSAEIMALAEAVKRFEKNTGYKIEIR